MNNDNLPPHISSNDKVILFDGICKLCNIWGAFIIKHDIDKIFKLCTVQSKEGKEILNYFNMPLDYFETIVFVQDGLNYKKSEAIFKIISFLPAPWKYFGIFKFLPVKLSDWCYDKIALNRYKLFGKYDSCVLPKSDHDARFINHDS